MENFIEKHEKESEKNKFEIVTEFTEDQVAHYIGNFLR